MKHKQIHRQESVVQKMKDLEKDMKTIKRRSLNKICWDYGIAAETIRRYMSGCLEIQKVKRKGYKKLYMYELVYIL